MPQRNVSHSMIRLFSCFIHSCGKVRCTKTNSRTFKTVEKEAVYFDCNLKFLLYTHCDERKKWTRTRERERLSERESERQKRKNWKKSKKNQLHHNPILSLVMWSIKMISRNQFVLLLHINNWSSETIQSCLNWFVCNARTSTVHSVVFLPFFSFSFWIDGWKMMMH